MIYDCPACDIPQGSDSKPVRTKLLMNLDTGEYLNSTVYAESPDEMNVDAIEYDLCSECASTIDELERGIGDYQRWQKLIKLNNIIYKRVSKMPELYIYLEKELRNKI